MMVSGAAVRNAKLSDKPFKIADKSGLYFLVSTTGKYRLMNYRFMGKQKTLVISAYLSISVENFPGISV